MTFHTFDRSKEKLKPGVSLRGPTGATGGAGATGAAGPGYTATSTTSLLIAVASKSFTTQAGLAYTVGARARASSAVAPTNYMEGLVTSYSGTTLIINIDHIGGSGTLADWNINLAGEVGATGSAGAAGSVGATGPAGAQGATGAQGAAGSGGNIAVIPGAAWVIHTGIGIGDWSSADINNGGQSVLVTTDTGSAGSAYLSTDGLATLTEFTSTPPGHSRYHACGLSTDAQTIIITGDTVFRYSTDQGASWGGAGQSSAPTNECCSLTKSGTLQFVFAQDTTTYLRYNGATGKTHGLSNASGVTIDTTGDMCVVSSNTSGCVYSTNVSAGSPTFNTSAGISGNVVGLAGDLSGADIIAAKYADYIYKSTDSGANFTAQTAWGQRNWEGCKSSGDGLILAGWTDTQIFRSADGGATVYEITPADIVSIAALGMSEDGLYFIVADDGGYLYTLFINPGSAGGVGAQGATGTQGAVGAQGATGSQGATGDISVIVQNSQSANYTLVLSDAGKHIYHPSADTTARSWTIPGNGSVAYTIGTAITFVNDTSAGVITLAITTDTLVLSPAGTTGSRTLAAGGMATAIKVTSTRWLISGTGLT